MGNNPPQSLADSLLIKKLSLLTMNFSRDSGINRRADARQIIIVIPANGMTI